MASHYGESIGLIEDATVTGEFHEVVGDEFRGFLSATDLRIHQSFFKFEQSLRERSHYLSIQRACMRGGRPIIA
jgi:hypothetical protein